MKNINFYTTFSFREKKRSKEITCFVLHFSTDVADYTESSYISYLFILNVVVSYLFHYQILKYMSSIKNIKKYSYEH